MTTDDQGKKDESSQTLGERLEEIKSEEKEDASDYYAQEDSKDNVNEAAQLSGAVEPVKAEREEMNLLKAVAFLGFGMAALAIIFILFFVRDLDTRVVGIDGTVTNLEDKIAPLKRHVDDGLRKVNEDIAGLKTKVVNYERMMAVMELKRALVTVQEMSLGNSPDINAKSGEVVAGIEALLTELGAGETLATRGIPAGIVSLEEAPVSTPEVAEEPAEPGCDRQEQGDNGEVLLLHSAHPQSGAGRRPRRSQYTGWRSSDGVHTGLSHGCTGIRRCRGHG